MRFCLLCIAFLLLLSTAAGQDNTVLIHIRLIDGRNGKPMKNKEFSFGFRFDARPRSVRTDEFGVASLNVGKGATIYIYNTDKYRQCADEEVGGGATRSM